MSSYSWEGAVGSVSIKILRAIGEKKQKTGGAQQGLRDLMTVDENKTFPGEIPARLTAD